MSYNCHLVEVERLRAKLMAGAMHQARWPGVGEGTSPLLGGDRATPWAPGPWIPTQCVMHGNAPWGKEAVWVMWQTTSSWDMLRAVTPEEEATSRRSLP